MSDTGRLLIVDDEQRGRETLDILLVNEPYQLLHACNGKQALQIAKEHLPDLILLDIMMPDISGFDVCAQLRTHLSTAEIPIILITALDDEQSRLQGIEAGADDFISKPFNRLELRARIRSIMRLNRYRRLTEERHRLNWVVEHAEEGYLILQTGKHISYANNRAATYLNLQKDNLPTQDFLEYAQQQGYLLEPEFLWQNWTDPNLLTAPRYLVRPANTQQLALWLQIEVLDEPYNTLNNLLVRLHDVSAQMSLQQQMWSFQAMVSHKLRAPLNGLVSLQILDSGTINLQSERAKILIQIAQESAKRLQEQILDILRYVDSPQLLNSENLFPITQIPLLIEKICWELNLTSFAISMNNQFQNAMLPCPEQAIELILQELLTNSQKFHPEQNPDLKITIETPDTNITDPSTPLKKVTLCIMDNGKHLISKDLIAVWSPYYQSEKLFTGEIAGMGLGLPMIAQMVIALGGQVRLQNRTDSIGVAVFITLPVIYEKQLL